MVDLSAHHMTYQPRAVRVDASRRSFAYGLMVAAPVSLVLWAAIAWAAAQVL